MYYFHEHHPASIKSQPASPSLTKQHLASSTQPHPVLPGQFAGQSNLILRNLLGSGNCAWGTEEHNFQCVCVYFFFPQNTMLKADHKEHLWTTWAFSGIRPYAGFFLLHFSSLFLWNQLKQYLKIHK